MRYECHACCVLGGKGRNAKRKTSATSASTGNTRTRGSMTNRAQIEMRRGDFAGSSGLLGTATVATSDELITIFEVDSFPCTGT
jgi:hypothetical protein